jgi:hypothetical protein
MLEVFYICYSLYKSISNDSIKAPTSDPVHHHCKLESPKIINQPSVRRCTS